MSLPGPGTKVHVAIGSSVRIGIVEPDDDHSLAYRSIRVALTETPTAFGATYYAKPEQITVASEPPRVPAPVVECGRLFPGGRVGRRAPARTLTLVEAGQVAVLVELGRSLRESGTERLAASYKSAGRRLELRAESDAYFDAAKRAEATADRIRRGGQ